MDIGLEILGERTIDLRFDQFPKSAHALLRQAIETETGKLAALVRAAAPKKSGKLAASIQERVTDGANRISGVVGVTGDFGKAGALEYGSHREITMKLSHVFSTIVPTLDVRRRLNIEAREFLRGPEREIAPEAFAAMQEAVRRAVDE